MSGVLQLGLFRPGRVRLVRQTEAAECGLACLAMVANRHGLEVDLGTLRRAHQSSNRGARLGELMEAADRLSLGARAVRVSLEDLDQLRTPAILHWDMKHFVVLDGVAGGRALIHDPAGSSGWLPMDRVSRSFTGVALEIEPTDEFEPADRRETLRLSQLWRRLTGLKRTLLQTAILTLVMQAFVLASPYYMQVALDSAVPALDGRLLAVLAMGFAIFTLINAGAALLRSFVLLSAGTTVSYGIATNIARRLFRLPIGWFERRHTGDVLSRFQSVAPIRQFLTEDAVAAALDGSLAVLTLALMFLYSGVLAVISFATFVLYAILRAATYLAQRDTQAEAISAMGREQSALIETLRGMTTIRIYGKEAERLAYWKDRLTDSMNAGVALLRITTWQTAGNTVLIGLESVLSIYLSIRLVMTGGFSLGMVFAFLAYKTQFLQRATSFADKAVAFRMLGLHLERLSDIALTPPDVSFLASRPAERVLRGGIELRGVTFRYGPAEPPILHELDLVVQPGEHVAITGPSGGGKSTLLKILLGLIEPDHGAVLIDGDELARFGHKNFHDQIGAVLQDDHLFAGSLSHNIALFDEAPDMARVAAAAEAAALAEDIAAMPMRYDTLVGDMGSTLSGGQRQRLLLARALYRKPRLLVMDEGTSHLDPERERQVNAAVARMGITRIVVAHRRETIMAADRVLILDGGRLHAR